MKLTESLMARELFSWPSRGKVPQPLQEDSAKWPELSQSCLFLCSRAISKQQSTPAAFTPYWLVPVTFFRDPL